MPSMGSTIGRYTPTGAAIQCASTQLTHAHLQVWVHRQSYLDVFRKEECVYLAAEATDVLQTLDPSKVYIMGAFVDKNRHKSLCYDRAVAAGVATARLPIGEFVKMRSRKVLTTNHGVWLWVAVGGCVWLWVAAHCVGVCQCLRYWRGSMTVQRGKMRSWLCCLNARVRWCRLTTRMARPLPQLPRLKQLRQPPQLPQLP